MTPEKTLKRINIGAFIISLIYVADSFLPTKVNNGKLIEYYRAYNGSSGYNNSDIELVINTTQGKITVLKSDILPYYIIV